MHKKKYYGSFKMCNFSFERSQKGHYFELINTLNMSLIKGRSTFVKNDSIFQKPSNINDIMNKLPSILMFR